MEVVEEAEQAVLHLLHIGHIGQERVLDDWCRLTLTLVLVLVRFDAQMVPGFLSHAPGTNTQGSVDLGYLYSFAPGGVPPVINKNEAVSRVLPPALALLAGVSPRAVAVALLSPHGRSGRVSGRAPGALSL